MTDDHTTVSVAPQALIKHRRSRLVVPLVVVAVILLVGGVVGFYALSKTSDRQADHSMTTDQYARYQKAQDLAASVKDADPTTKAIQLTAAANLMAEAGQDQKSLDYYLQAQKVIDENNLRQTASLDFTEQIGDAYAVLGDKVKAKQYYTKAIDFTKSQTSDPNITKEVEALEAKRNKL